MSKIIFDKIRNTLFDFESEITRVSSIVEQKEELMKLHSASMNNREYILAKLDRNNYQTYKIRLMRIKRRLERRFKQIMGEYQGDTAKLLYAYFVEEKSIENIAKEFNLTEKVVVEIISKKEIELEKFNKI